MNKLAPLVLSAVAFPAFAAPPTIVSTSPKIGATDVNPSTTTVLTVTFDQPMSESFSWTGGGEQFPQIPDGNKPYWSLDKKTCTLPVQLEPGKSYQLGINSRSHRNFKNVDGEPVEPAVFSFETGSGEMTSSLPTPSTASGDLLFSDDLETGDKAPAGWTANEIDGVQLTWDERVTHSGKRSLRLHKTANRYFPIASWARRVDHTNADAEAIRVEAFVRTNKAKKIVLDVLFLDAGGSPLGHEWVAYIGEDDANPNGVSADWTPYSGAVAIPKETKSIEVSAQIYGPGMAWVDDVNAIYVGVDQVKAK